MAAKKRELLPTQLANPEELIEFADQYARSIEWYEKHVKTERRIGVARSPQFFRFLAIDPGTKNVAIVYWADGKTPQSFKVDDLIKAAKLSFDSTAGHLLYIEAVIRFFLATRDIDVIFKEGVAHYKTHGVAEAGRIQQMIERLAIEYRVPYMTINPMTMRRFIETTEKSSTKLQVYKRWNLEFASEDETDAFALLQTGLAIMRGEFYHTVAEEKAAKKAAKEAA